MIHLAVIPGHGMRGGRYDPGATAGDLVEAAIVRRQAAALLSMAPDRVSVHDLAEGSRRGYSRRRAAASAAIAASGGPGVIVHLHCNAGGGDYAFAGHDPRSDLGRRRAAEWLAAGAPRRLKMHGVGRVRSISADASAWPNVWAVLRRSYGETPADVAAILVECAFVDQPRHARMWTDSGVDALAQSLLDAWR